MPATSQLAKTRKAARRTAKAARGFMVKALVKQVTLADKRLLYAEVQKLLADVPATWRPSAQELRRVNRTPRALQREAAKQRRRQRATERLARARAVAARGPYLSGRGNSDFLREVTERLDRELTTWRQKPRATADQFFWLRTRLTRYAEQYGYYPLCQGPWVTWHSLRGRESYTFLINQNYHYRQLQRLWARRGTYRVTLLFNETDPMQLGDFAAKLTERQLPMTVMNLTDRTMMRARVISRAA